MQLEKTMSPYKNQYVLMENQTATSKHFSSIAGFSTLNQLTVGRWLKIEQNLHHELERGNAKAVRTSKVKHPELEECLS